VSASLGQYCIEVPDLENTVAMYEALGLTCTSRTEIDAAYEAIIEHPAGGSKMQLAQRKDKGFELGNAFWKLYINTHDIAAIHQRALDAGCHEVMAPSRQERWPVTISFVRDPDGYLIELVERHPWPDDVPTDGPWLGQYCINVTDIEATVRFYETLGLTCTSRTEIPQAFEAIIESSNGGSKLQLAQQKDPGAAIELGAVWKLYVNTDDCAGTHARALDAGFAEEMAPTALDRWPVTISFLIDPDGYRIELVQFTR
jgi:lactoylglutathione lyase